MVRDTGILGTLISTLLSSAVTLKLRECMFMPSELPALAAPLSSLSHTHCPGCSLQALLSSLTVITGLHD